MKGYLAVPIFLFLPPRKLRHKIPESVLVVIYTPALDVLLIRRADEDSKGPEFWQSVTGSKDRAHETFTQTAVREVMEETGIACVAAQGAAAPALQAASHSALLPVLHDWWLENVYDIYPRWTHRYAPGVTRNTEHMFGLQVTSGMQVCLNPHEHTASVWLPWREAAARCFSPSNAEAILMLPRFFS